MDNEYKIDKDQKYTQNLLHTATKQLTNQEKKAKFIQYLHNQESQRSARQFKLDQQKLTQKLQLLFDKLIKQLQELVDGIKIQTLNQILKYSLNDIIQFFFQKLIHFQTQGIKNKRVISQLQNNTKICFQHVIIEIQNKTKDYQSSVNKAYEQNYKNIEIKLKREINGLKSEINALNNKNQQLIARIQRSNRYFDERTILLVSQQYKIYQLQRANEELLTKLEQLSRRNNKLEQKVIELTENAQQLENKCASLRNSIQDLGIRLDNAINRHDTNRL